MGKEEEVEYRLKSSSTVTPSIPPPNNTTLTPSQFSSIYQSLKGRLIGIRYNINGILKRTKSYSIYYRLLLL